MLNSEIWGARKDLDNEIFLVTPNQTMSFGEVIHCSDELFKDTSRELVLILCSRDIESIISYIGAVRSSLIPLLVESDIKDDALNRIIEEYKPKYIFHKISRLPPFLSNLNSQDTLFNGYQLSEYDVPSKEIYDDLGLLLLTSGSTGDPKSVRITLSNIQNATQSITEYLNLSPERIALSLLPFHYSYGLSVIHNALYSRSKIFLSDKSVLEKEIWDEVIKYGVTDISGVPFIFEMMARMKLPHVYEEIICMTQAGGRLSPKFTEHFLKLSKKHKFKYFTMYGQTEASPRISFVPYDHAFDKIGTVGIPISCGNVSLDRSDPKSVEGELIYTGPNVCLGYAESAEDLSLQDEFKGKLRTGDIATIDEDGYIKIVGRSKRFVKLKGISVNLDHIESLINNLGITGCVIGKDDKVIIVLESREQHEKVIHDLIGDNFNFHKSLVNYVEEEIPYLSSGKPNYQELNNRLL